VKLFLGIDGGQSSTVALIADEEGRVLGSGRGGACNHVAQAEGHAKFARAITACLGAACTQARLNPAAVSFAAACLGFSGGIADKEPYSREFIRSHAFKFTHDAEIALTGATAGQPGIIVIAGTGSIAFGKNADGKLARAGGWGYLFGDEGGAFDLVRRALRAALAMEEGWGPHTALRDQLLTHTGAASANALMHNWYNQFDRTKIALLARLLDETANQGDAISQQILESAGHDLAALVSHVHGMLFPIGEVVHVSYVGGVFESAGLKTALQQRVQQALHCHPVPPLLPPAAGALLEALHLGGIHVPLSQIPSIKR
jgi:N-acetylglucosamine kinase-like BadF-type ATPase